MSELAKENTAKTVKAQKLVGVKGMKRHGMHRKHHKRQENSFTCRPPARCLVAIGGEARQLRLVDQHSVSVCVRAS
jgi:hypothetical protein